MYNPYSVKQNNPFAGTSIPNIEDWQNFDWRQWQQQQQPLGGFTGRDEHGVFAAQPGSGDIVVGHAGMFPDEHGVYRNFAGRSVEDMRQQPGARPAVQPGGTPTQPGSGWTRARDMSGGASVWTDEQGQEWIVGPNNSYVERNAVMRPAGQPQSVTPPTAVASPRIDLANLFSQRSFSNDDAGTMSPYRGAFDFGGHNWTLTDTDPTLNQTIGGGRPVYRAQRYRGDGGNYEGFFVQNPDGTIEQVHQDFNPATSFWTDIRPFATVLGAAALGGLASSAFGGGAGAAAGGTAGTAAGSGASYLWPTGSVTSGLTATGAPAVTSIAAPSAVSGAVSGAGALSPGFFAAEGALAGLGSVGAGSTLAATSPYSLAQTGARLPSAGAVPHDAGLLGPIYGVSPSGPPPLIPNMGGAVTPPSPWDLVGPGTSMPTPGEVAVGQVPSIPQVGSQPPGAPPDINPDNPGQVPPGAPTPPGAGQRDWLDRFRDVLTRFGGGGGGQPGGGQGGMGLLPLIAALYGRQAQGGYADDLRGIAEGMRGDAEPFLSQLRQTYTNPQAFLDSPEMAARLGIEANRLTGIDARHGRLSNDIQRTALLQAYGMRGLEDHRRGLQQNIQTMYRPEATARMFGEASAAHRARNADLMALAGMMAMGGGGGGASGVENIINDLRGIVDAGGDLWEWINDWF